MSDERSRVLDELAELEQLFEKSIEEFDKETDNWWNNLSEEDQQRAFYSVMKRVVQGELRDRGSYRHILYDTFGFDHSAYAMGLRCGFMELHNSIYTQEEMRELRDRELKAAGVKVTTIRI